MDENNWLEKGQEYWDKKEYEQAVKCFIEGDKAGDAECTAYLGTCYYCGTGVEADLHKAAFYCEKAAQSNDVEGMFCTGLCYEYGYGVPQDIGKALFWYEKAGEAHNHHAFAKLGSIYQFGNLVDKNYEKSFEYYQKAAQEGNHVSKLYLAYFYMNGIVVEKDIEKAKELTQEAYDTLLKLAIIHDDVDAQYRLGNIYFKGLSLIGIASNFSQAFEWYTKIQQRNDYAQIQLGIMYAFGLGVEQSYEKAFYWYSKAAERNNAIALCNVGNCYYRGHGVEQDYSKSAEYHSKAAHLGNGLSQEVLGELYISGKGVKQSYTQAVFWLKKSCEKGIRSAYCSLGDCYRKGLGVDQDEKTAFELYQKGANAGDTHSKVSLAECLIEGWGTVSNDQQALQILESLCNDAEKYRKNLVNITEWNNELGNNFFQDPLDDIILRHYAKAYYLLGTLYYAGKGSGGSDVSKAITMLRMADRLGYHNEDAPNETAEKLLNRIIESRGKKQACNAIDCYVEVRERKKIANGELYQVILHHADGSESEVKFKGRKKFIYILALLIAHEGDSVCGMTAKHFSYCRDMLADMVKTSRLNVGTRKDWIDEFIYAETDESKDNYDSETAIYGLNSEKYSNALSGANRDIKASCISDDEFEIFKLRSTGGRYAITTMSLDNTQITLPHSLEYYRQFLPTQDEIARHNPKKGRELLRKN